MIDLVLAQQASAVVTVDEQYVNMALGVVLPFLVGLVTKKVTSANVKRTLLVVLSILGGALAQIAAQGGTFDVKDVVIGSIVTYFTAQTAYSAVLKPTGIADKVNNKTANVGLTIKADPAKQAALAGQATTASAAAAVVGSDVVVAPVGEVADVGDEIAVEPTAEDEAEGTFEEGVDAEVDEAEDVEALDGDDEPDVEPEPVIDEEDSGLPYDVDPDDEIGVVDPDDLPKHDPDEQPQQ